MATTRGSHTLLYVCLTAAVCAFGVVLCLAQPALAEETASEFELTEMQAGALIAIAIALVVAGVALIWRFTRMM